MELSNRTSDDTFSSNNNYLCDYQNCLLNNNIDQRNCVTVNDFVAQCEFIDFKSAIACHSIYATNNSVDLNKKLCALKRNVLTLDVNDALVIVDKMIKINGSGIIKYGCFANRNHERRTHSNLNGGRSGAKAKIRLLVHSQFMCTLVVIIIAMGLIDVASGKIILFPFRFFFFFTEIGVALCLNENENENSIERMKLENH